MKKSRISDIRLVNTPNVSASACSGGGGGAEDVVSVLWGEGTQCTLGGGGRQCALGGRRRGQS